ncbi:MAG: MGMT family protein [Chloroflexota bacterium]|nr:MGMT family protein [Chloroflexota bacterium]
MAKSRKTWREKLESPRQAEVVDDRRGRGRLLIPRPLDVDALMRQVPVGKLATVEQVRQRLARDHGADLTCPLTTGIFIRIAAEVAEEDMNAGKADATPYWRVVKADGSLNDKLPGGVQAQAARLREEGHGVEPGKGKRPPRVKDFERSLHGL